MFVIEVEAVVGGDVSLQMPYHTIHPSVHESERIGTSYFLFVTMIVFDSSLDLKKRENKRNWMSIEYSSVAER